MKSMEKAKEQKKEKDRKKEKTKKAAYVPVSGILGEAADYHVYRMRAGDRLAAAAIGIGLAFAVIFIFFRSILLSAIAGAVMAVVAQRFYRDYKRRRRQKNLLIQFKDLLESLSASYSAGENTQAAFADAESDMISIYGEQADIVQETRLITGGIANNITVEKLLENFALRSGLDDVESFANVFEVANRQGSNLKQVIADSREIINDKIEIEMEIETMLAGNKNELNVMILMPLVIVLSLNSMGTMTINSNTPGNVLIKVICIGIFAAAYLMGKKITDIRL